MPTIVCPYGAAPNAAGQNAQFVWVSLATFAASRLPEWTRLNPWIVGALADRVVNVQALCDSNPPMPDPITPQDILLTAIDPIVGPGFSSPAFEKIVQSLYYDAFRTLCNCTTGTGVCVPTTVQISTATNACWHPPSNSYCWPTTNHGTVTNPIFAPYPWPFACNTVDIFIDTVPHIDGVILNSFNIYDCANINHGRETQAGSTTRVTLSNCPGDPTRTSLNYIISDFSGGGHPNWVTIITPVGNSGLGPQPPVQPPDTTGPIPTPPPLRCDSNTTCNINWGIVNRLTQNIQINTNVQTTVNEGLATSYVEGNSYQATGSGVQVVAQGTLGVVIEIVSVPPLLEPTQTDPPRYHDLGYIQLAAADALDGKRWIHSSGDRFIPVFPEMDRVHYNLTEGVVVNIVELIPPPVSSSSTALAL